MMKRSDIEKRLKKEAREHTPELYDKIVLSAKSEGLLQDSPENVEIYKQGNTAVLAKGKRRSVTGILFAFVAIVACLAILLPFLLKKTTVPPILPTNITLSTNDVYGMGAVSTVKLLGSDTSVRALTKFSSVRSVTAKADPSGAEAEAKAQARKFNEYFTALDSFMGEEIVTTMSETNADLQYPYETKLTIDSKDFNGNAVRHVMYFTETLKERDEEEEIYTLKGVLVVDGMNYHLEGGRSIESEDGETENELEIRAYADLSDKTSYVEMAQEHSIEDGETETEYVYSIYSGGTLVEQTAIEFESEKDGAKEEVEYELEFRKGEAKGKYVVEHETENGEIRIKVKYDIDGKQGSFTIEKSSDNTYVYHFADGTVLSF